MEEKWIKDSFWFGWVDGDATVEKMIQRQIVLSPTIGPNDLQVQESSVLDQTCLNSLPKYRENENMKLLANKAFERPFQWPYGLWDTKSQKGTVALIFFFFKYCFCHFEDLTFCFVFPDHISRFCFYSSEWQEVFSVCFLQVWPQPYFQD